MPDRRWRIVLSSVLGTLVVITLLSVGFVMTGAYDVSATDPHARVTRWLFSTTMNRSVAARAGELERPLPSDDAALEHGLAHFHAMCVVCHGAPGIERGEFGQGMEPTPPRLERAAEQWSDAELVWIIRNGVKLAGMPAFGPTHGEEELRQIAAVVRRLPALDSAAYHDWAVSAGLPMNVGSHGHGAAAGDGAPADGGEAADGTGAVHIHSDGSSHVH